MPFKKVGSDDYKSPSGRHFNKAQVNLYYATGGTFDKKDIKHAHHNDHIPGDHDSVMAFPGCCEPKAFK